VTAAATHAREDQAGVGDAPNDTSAADARLAFVPPGLVSDGGRWLGPATATAPSNHVQRVADVFG
jgi:hypothetical protein